MVKGLWSYWIYLVLVSILVKLYVVSVERGTVYLWSITYDDGLGKTKRRCSTVTAVHLTWQYGWHSLMVRIPDCDSGGVGSIPTVYPSREYFKWLECVPWTYVVAGSSPASLICQPSTRFSATEKVWFDSRGWQFTAVDGSMVTTLWVWKNHSVQSHRTRHGRIVGMEANGSWSLRHA